MGGLFGVGPEGKPPIQEATSVQITRAVRKLGLHGVSHHTMRHTGITLILGAGVNPRVIQKLAGWTSLRMLERYGHVRDAEAQRAVTTMQALIQKGIERPNQTEKASTQNASTESSETWAQS